MKKKIRKILKTINIIQLGLFIIMALVALIIYLDKEVLFYNAILEKQHFLTLTIMEALLIIYGIIEIIRFILIRPIYKLYIIICALIIAFTETNDSLFTIAVAIVLVITHIYTHFLDEDYMVEEKKEIVKIDDEIIWGENALWKRIIKKDI